MLAQHSRGYQGPMVQKQLDSKAEYDFHLSLSQGAMKNGRKKF